MMEDPFQLIFAQAAAHGLRLSSLSQDGAGAWRAKWRRDNATPDGQSIFAERAESTDPFHALKDALAVAVRTIPAPKDYAQALVESAKVPVEDFGDLF